MLSSVLYTDRKSKIWWWAYLYCWWCSLL